MAVKKSFHSFCLGIPTVKRRTSKKKFVSSLHNFKEWLPKNLFVRGSINAGHPERRAEWSEGRS